MALVCKKNFEEAKSADNPALPNRIAAGTTSLKAVRVRRYPNVIGNQRKNCRKEGYSSNIEQKRDGNPMKILLTEYDEKWARVYEEEAHLLKNILGKEIIRFEHFGSTAVPGMKAKPVIDMMCIVREIEIIDGFNEQMYSLGYDIAGEWGIQGRRLFRKGGENRTHHIHIYQFDNPQIQRHLIFRDYLRTHPDEVELYRNMKEELAQRFDDTSSYSKAKKPFVQEVENRALQWYSDKNK